MSTKHTPGPWHVVPRSGPGGITAEITFGDVGECIAEGVYEMADAVLIAALPDLLEALDAVLEWEPRQKDEQERIAYEKARAAIARATGKESK